MTMSSKEQGQKNVRDANAAWEAFRSLIHGMIPGTAQALDRAARLASQKRNY
jgi:hypothetical protein